MSKPGPTAKPKTQLQRAKAIVERYKKWTPILKEIQDDLDAVLSEAQNRPPEGVADGSISDESWGRLRDLADALGDLLGEDPR